MNKDTTASPSLSDWATLPIDPAQQSNLAALGFSTMTPVQAATLPLSLAGGDLIAQAKTGSGKTAAFAIPLLQKLNVGQLAVQSLVLCPTRELADQVCAEIRRLARAYDNVKVLPLCGGVALRGQTASLENGAHIVVGTPGRVLDHLQRGNLALSTLTTLVLDEADRMLDIGFLPDLQRILSHLPKQRTTLLFSATFSNDIKRLANSYLQDPVTIEVARSNATAATVEQRFYSASGEDKRLAMLALIKQHDVKQAFVFVNSKLGCARLARNLERDGLRTAAMHGDKSQDERLKALAAFKAGEVDLLVCTDVAARGLDIKDVPVVFNIDLPFNAEDYVHRIGRTGRAGASGLAISLVSSSDARLLGDIEKLIKIKAEVEPVEFERAPTRGRRDERGGRDADEGRERREPRIDKHDEDRLAKRAESRDPKARYQPLSRQTKSDPLFDQPYQPSLPPDAKPAWEAAPAVKPRGISANIKPRRKVAALFKSTS